MKTLHGRFGHVIIDEAHRAVSALYQETLKHTDARFLLGLSATPFRRDGLTKLLEYSLGEIVTEVDKEELVQAGRIVRARTQWVRTRFSTELDASQDYAGAIRELTLDTERNRLLCRTIAEEPSPGPHLVLSDRKEHCRLLQSMLLSDHGIRAEVLVGGLDPAHQAAALESVRTGQCRHLIGTSQFLGEGFDLPSLQVLYLTVPLRFRGKLIQNIGRVLRASSDKSEALIYDFADTGVGVFKASAMARVRIYTSLGIVNRKAVGEG
jgi:superfamily II DNA or RNA helicase